MSKELATADEPAPILEAEPGDCARPRSPGTVFVITADPRSEPKELPAFANPALRPEGAEPALMLAFYSPVLTGEDIALGKMPRRDTERFLRAIRGAGNRNINFQIDCSGGDAESALSIARALLEHPYRVQCRIVGRCSSAATYFALSADTRSIDPAGSVLIHRAARICTKEQFDALRLLSADDKVAINESLNDDDDASAALLTSRLGVPEETARTWMLADRKWSATEALAHGFVDAIASENGASTW